MDRRERHCLHPPQEDENWPSVLLEADGVGELVVVVWYAVEEVLGVGAVDEVPEHGAKRVRAGTELDVELSVDMLGGNVQSSLTWSGL